MSNEEYCLRHALRLLPRLVEARDAEMRRALVATISESIRAALPPEPQPVLFARAAAKEPA